MKGEKISFVIFFKHLPPKSFVNKTKQKHEFGFHSFEICFISLNFIATHTKKIAGKNTDVDNFPIQKNIPPLSSTPSPNVNFKMIKDHILLPMLIINHFNLEWGRLDW